jgi:hypothetical protein
LINPAELHDFGGGHVKAQRTSALSNGSLVVLNA